MLSMTQISFSTIAKLQIARKTLEHQTLKCHCTSKAHGKNQN
jgi:hypothetical protein